jgi:hypothetical protein
VPVRGVGACLCYVLVVVSGRSIGATASTERGLDGKGAAVGLATEMAEVDRGTVLVRF